MIKFYCVVKRIENVERYMKVEYDSESDIFYIQIKDGKIEETVDLDADIFADLNDKGEILGIEIWQARKYVFPELLKFLNMAKNVYEDKILSRFGYT